MAKPYVPQKFKDLGILMRTLRSIQGLDYQQCWAIYGQKKDIMLNNCYKQIAETAARV